MARRAVVGRRDIGRLGGSVVERKLCGRILLARSDEDFEAALEIVPALANELLIDWLIGPLPPLISTIAKRASRPELTRDAATVLLHESIRQSRFVVLGMLTTNEFEPYLALARIDDADEVRRQTSAMESMLKTRGRVRRDDLPQPLRQRSLLAWRDSILRHGEFLGLGSYSDGELVSWAP
jgi:hypothetical protein